MGRHSKYGFPDRGSHREGASLPQQDDRVESPGIGYLNDAAGIFGAASLVVRGAARILPCLSIVFVMVLVGGLRGLMGGSPACLRDHMRLTHYARKKTGDGHESHDDGLFGSPHS